MRFSFAFRVDQVGAVVIRIIGASWQQLVFPLDHIPIPGLSDSLGGGGGHKSGG